MILSQQLNSITLNVEKQYIDYLHGFFSFLDMDYDLDNSTFYLKNYSIVDFNQFKNKMDILSDKEKIQFVSVMTTDLYNQLVYLQSVDRSFLQISPEHFYIFKKESDYFFLYVDFANLYTIDKNEIYLDKPFIKTRFCDHYISQIVELDVHESKLKLEYINSILGSYNEIEVRKALSKIIESEISKQVLANSLENYSFMILDPPVLPLKKFSPRRTIICLTFALSALLIHIIILSISYGFKIRGAADE